MSPLIIAALIVGLVGYVLLMAWALCRAAALGDQAPIVDDLEDRRAA